MRHLGRDFTTFFLIAMAWILFGKTSDAQRLGGSVHLDVVVTDATGKPVSGLREPEFRLLDDGNEQPVASFRAFDPTNTKAEPPVQMVLIVDCVNSRSAELGYIRQGLKRFLSLNNGRLSQPTTIVRFAPSGVDFLSNASTDGTALAASLDQIGAVSKPVELDTFASSLNALTSVVNEVANEPGRKMLIWLGPGWHVPVPGPHVLTTIDEHGRRADYELMVQLMKTMEEGRISLYGGYKDAGFYLHDPLKPVRKVSEVTPRDLALEVLALKSGGHGALPMIARESVVSDLLNDFVAEAGTFYTLSFDPPRARGADEFHELKVVLDRPDLTLRTITGYYNEPEFFQARLKDRKTDIAQQDAVEVPSALASTTVYGTGGQTPPLRDPSVVQKALAPLSTTDPVVRDGLLSINIVVTDATGNPVSNLEPWDFSLLDNGRPAKIRTLHNARAPSASAPELIFVLDTIDISPQQLTQTGSALVRFLQRDNGRPDFRCFLYRITRDGLFSSLVPTQDGNTLVQEVEQHKSPRTLWTSVSSQRNPLSLRALGSIAIDQRDIPGHKVVVWIGPGWPVNGGNMGFDEATELSTRLQEGRITLDNINLSPNPNHSFDYHDYPEGPRSQKDMQAAQMALQVIATHTGGLVLNSSEDLDQDIERCAREVRNFYTLTFNPPHTYQMDEYHTLRVHIDRPSLMARAPTGYYNEPVYFDNPRPGIEKVTVAQLEELVHSGNCLQQKLTNLELTERLDTARLDALLNTIQGERERQALRADADLSISLAPPPDEIVNQSPPSAEEQRTILQRIFDYLENVIPKLPDLSASRDTVRFKESDAPPEKESWKMPHQDQILHFATGEHATVFYRNGHEVDEAKKKLSITPAAGGMEARDPETNGTFGPILAYVLTAKAASPSTLIWKRWEHSKDGDLAVFSYRAGTKNAPELTYCCLPEGDGTTLYRNKADTFGEFAVNPNTGAIMRIVVNADLNEERDPNAPLIRSQVLVEYGPEELDGKDYTCPRRRVEISRGRSERQLHEWGMVFSVYSYFKTTIDDSSFGGYHKFGSEMRILPGFEETKGAKPPPPENERTVIAQEPAIDVPGAPNSVTVARLTDLVASAKGKGDLIAAKTIEHLQLTERLSSSKLATLRAELAGTKSRNALTAVADASVFLEPPANETPQKAAPDAAEQERIMSLAVDYLKKINPKLPNFYAKRLTTLFEENSAQKNEKGGHEEHALRTAGEFSATVYYREGKEVEHAHGKQEQELITQGTFGPILSTVIVDMAHSWTQWARWEEGPNGPMAVFRFQVQQAESHYRTSMPTFLPLLDAMDPTAYHGEIGIDPTSGTILRLVLQADPDLGSTLQRADIMVEYGPVVIGEKSYTCPVRSVSIATAGEWFSSGRMTRLDDVVFNDYHVFRSEMRILP